MSQPRYDVAGIGNAIVDVLARTEDDVLARLDVPKGAMMLIDEPRAEAIYAAMAQTMEMSGGSAANTIVGCGMLGLKPAFIGKVRNDQLGASFGHGIRAAGVDFPTAAATDGPATARCYILVTPDGDRASPISRAISGIRRRPRRPSSRPPRSPMAPAARWR